MIRTAKIYTHRPITIMDLKDFIIEAERIGAEDDTIVSIRQAPRSNHPTDPGGEVTVEVSVGS